MRVDRRGGDFLNRSFTRPSKVGRDNPKNVKRRMGSSGKGHEQNSEGNAGRRGLLFLRGGSTKKGSTEKLRQFEKRKKGRNHAAAGKGQVCLDMRNGKTNGPVAQGIRKKRERAGE